MKLCGLQKTTLLDFPGKVAATIFTGGCSFACPFCHNSELLGRDTEALCSQEEVMTFLEKRKNILDGVCITGGEPTLQPDLEDFIRFVRSLGLAVKLDTNGYQPNVLINLCEKGLFRLCSYGYQSRKKPLCACKRAHRAESGTNRPKYPFSFKWFCPL